MNCDIVIEIGKDKKVIINKESSEQELDSLLDIVQHLKSTYSEKEFLEIADFLKYADSRVDVSKKYLLGKLLIGNCSLDELRQLFPKETETLKDGNYIITLIDEGYINGNALRGRIVTNGIVSYVIRDANDVMRLVNSERKKDLVKKIIENNVIQDEYLNKKYGEVLSIIAKHYKTDIKSLVIDYLDNLSNYNEIIKNKDLKINVLSELNDFCRELDNQEVFNDNSETDFAKYLRTLHSKREKIGKKDLHYALTTFFDSFKMSQDEFNNLSLDELSSLLLEYFSSDLIMLEYELISVADNIHIKSEVPHIEDHFKQILNKKNEQRKALGLPLLNMSLEKMTTNEAKEFFGNKINIGGRLFDLNIKKTKGKLEFTYIDDTINNDTKVLLQRKKQPIKELFGHSTLNIFNFVEKYLGLYIYEHTNTNGETIYLITGSIIHPEQFPIAKKTTLEEAKLTIEGMNRAADLSKSAKVALKTDSYPRRVKLGFLAKVGLVIESIDYPLKEKINLYSEESNLLKNAKIKEILEKYEKLGVDISVLNTPEEMATLLYALTEEDLLLQKLQEQITQEDINRIQSIANIIHTKPIKLFLVEGIDGDYYILKALTDSNIIVNSTGTDIKTLLTLTTTLFNLKTTLENTLFKDTGVNIIITDDQLLEQMTTEKGDKLFPDGVEGIKGFVYNDNIYINLSTASAEDMVHESLHILLGAMRVQNINNYKDILDYFLSKNDINKSIINGESKYKNLAYLDRVEEAVVRYIANAIYNSKTLYKEDTNPIIDDFIKQFNRLRADTKKELSVKLDSDLDFVTSAKTLITTNLKSALLNRIITNLIAEGIHKQTIIEDC